MLDVPRLEHLILLLALGVLNRCAFPAAPAELTLKVGARYYPSLAFLSS